jgi:hypothetical protein
MIRMRAFLDIQHESLVDRLVELSEDARMQVLTGFPDEAKDFPRMYKEDGKLVIEGRPDEVPFIVAQVQQTIIDLAKRRLNEFSYLDACCEANEPSNKRL